METILVQEAGERLDRWLSRRLQISRNQIQLYLKQGHILLNEKKAKPSYKLSAGDQLSITIPPPPSTEVLPEAIPLDIRYIDEEVNNKVTVQLFKDSLLVKKYHIEGESKG